METWCVFCRVRILCDNYRVSLPVVITPTTWAVGCVGHVNMTIEPTGSDNR
jgi:hypothetical protein